MRVRVRAALFVVREGRLLMALHEKQGRHYFLLPGGGVDAGEDWDAAARRELHEELGVQASSGPLLAVFENESPDGSRRIRHVIFRGDLRAGEPAPTGEDPRVVGCRWLDADELESSTVFPDVGADLARWLREGAPAGAAYERVAWTD